MNKKVEKLLNEYIEIVKMRKQIKATDFEEKGSLSKYNKLMDKLVKIAIKIEETYPEKIDMFCNLLLYPDSDVRTTVAGRILNNDYPMDWQEKAAEEFRHAMYDCLPAEKMIIEYVLNAWEEKNKTDVCKIFISDAVKAEELYWGQVLDDGTNHSKKIVDLDLDIDELSGFNHLAIFLRWAAANGLLSEKISEFFPVLKEIIENNEMDLRYVIANHPVFDGKLRARHFNKKGNAFAKHYYTFFSNGFAHCVDKFAEDFFGIEKYNCKEYKNEAYLFVPFDEGYYIGLSKYIDDAYEEFCRKEQNDGRDMVSLCAVCESINEIEIWKKWYEFCLSFEKSINVEFTHISYDVKSLNSDGLKTKKRCLKKLETAISNKDDIDCIEFYALPSNFKQAVFDFTAYMVLHVSREFPAYCEITIEKQMLKNIGYDTWIEALQEFLNIKEVEVNVLPHYAVFNYNKNRVILKSNGYHEAHRINNLYRWKMKNDNVKTELESIKNALAKPAVIFETGGKRPTKELMESWIGRVGWKASGEQLPEDYNGEPMVPVMTLFIKDLPYIPEEIKHIELITVFLSVTAIEECMLEEGDFCVRTYDSLEVLESCDWQTNYIKAFPLTSRVMEEDYPTWDSDDIPETIRTRILELENAGETDYFEDIAGADGCFHKIGGYPSYIQSGITWENYEFIFQITSDEKANFCFGDDGNIYFFYNKEEDCWGAHYDYY